MRQDPSLLTTHFLSVYFCNQKKPSGGGVSVVSLVLLWPHHHVPSFAGELACYYEMDEDEDASKRGILELNPKTKAVTSFKEKPAQGTSESRLASIVFYLFRKESFVFLREFLQAAVTPGDKSFGKYIEMLVTEKKTLVLGMKLPETFKLIGSVGLREYELCLSSPGSTRRRVESENITCQTCARVGLLGNPSDGFFGKTISLSIANFWAEATIVASEELMLNRHPINDPTSFGSLADLQSVSKREGYQGGLRLMQATCKKFYEYCALNGIAIARKNFTLSYDTNIPRQVGLAGSSAIVTSVFQCLMKFFNVTVHDIPKAEQPNFVLSVEMDELGINAGLQDRVIQAYSGAVYMNFDRELMAEQGHGDYIELDPKLLPPLWLAYLADPSDSGKAHNDVRKRFDAGNEEVIAGMKMFADITERGKAAVLAKDFATLADLMDENFALRRKLYTDPALGADNLTMVGIAQKHNAGAKFSGSGGAIVGLCRDQSKFSALQEELQCKGFVCVPLVANPAPIIKRSLTSSAVSFRPM